MVSQLARERQESITTQATTTTTTTTPPTLTTTSPTSATTANEEYGSGNSNTTTAIPTTNGVALGGPAGEAGNGTSAATTAAATSNAANKKKRKRGEDGDDLNGEYKTIDKKAKVEEKLALFMRICPSEEAEKEQKQRNGYTEGARKWIGRVRPVLRCFEHHCNNSVELFKQKWPALNVSAFKCKGGELCLGIGGQT